MQQKLLGGLVLTFVALAVSTGGPTAAQQRQESSAPGLLEPFARKAVAGEVMSVDPDKKTLVVRVLENGGAQRDMSFTLDDRTVLKKLRTPISRGDLSPGHLVKVTYSEHAGRLVARRIEVTGKAVHPPMP